MPSLPPNQKAALDRWLKAVDEVTALAARAVQPADETPPQGRFIAVLREEGAAEDLSNVDVGFKARHGLVGVYFWIKRSADGTGPIINNDFAKLKEREAPPRGE